MRYVSTRGGQSASLSEAICRGSAPGGALFIPQTLPRISSDDVQPGLTLAELATQLLGPFFEGDALQADLPALCANAFDFPVPLTIPDPARPGLRALELFHGPTGAFKDFGTRFLMGALDCLADEDDPFTVLVATSGDTGGAAAQAAEGRKGVQLAVLYPKGRVSPFQEHQLTCWNAPVRAFRVSGDFDACQALVKNAFADEELTRRFRLTSANSINIVRLLPQMVYLADAALKVWRTSGTLPGLIIPSGNLGHGLAALYARSMGLPIGPVVIATNANATLHEWNQTGVYRPRPSVATLANAMDIGTPSNFERLDHLASDQRAISVERVDDDAIRARIIADFERTGYVWCPHSAIAAEAWHRLPEAAREQRVWIAAATAHPYKFADVVEPLIGQSIDPSAPLKAVLDRPSHMDELAADMNALSRALAGTFRSSRVSAGYA
ncbi:threonine synthase [Glycocaulis abyssi]|uniref:Threonine synthase n=1 Tax=Glycocaulis abyssi TaxID=1433403 RepID=A0ABV9NGL7_9PROT